MDVYKTDEARRMIRGKVKEYYTACPVPAESMVLNSEEFGDTHLLTAGNPVGRPLVLLHGSSGNSTAWFGMLKDLAADYRIFMADIPGQPGLSSSGRPALEGEVMSRWLGEILASIGVEKPYLAGMSLGAWIAMDFALRNPEGVSGVALLSPSGIRPAKLSFVFRVLPLTFMGKWGQKKLFGLIHGPIPVYPEMLEFARQIAGSYRPMIEVPAVFTDEQLVAADFPLLFIGGEKDVMLDMPGSAERIGKLLRESELVLRPGYSHVLPDEGGTIAGFFGNLASW